MKMDFDDEHLEMINFLMKVMILTATIFFVMAFVVFFFGFFGVQQLSSEETLFKLSPVIVLLLIFSVIFNLTRYRCPECHTFIKRRIPCPVCLAMKESRAAIKKVDEESSFLNEEDKDAVEMDEFKEEKLENPIEE
ncbi:MAG: hypothetical protein ACTSRU_07735 [Candidatus Hodarchaeales archaeon]